MERFERIFTLHQILSQRRQPISIKQLMVEMEYSESSVKRVIAEMRNLLNAPIYHDRQLNGYYYRNETNAPKFELPGLWFNSHEIIALLSLENMLNQIQPGLLDRELGPVRRRLSDLQKKMGHHPLFDAKRLRVLSMAHRHHQPQSFQKITTALFSRNRVEIKYHARSKNQTSSRTVSPQRLAYYRQNWFLDAWCHKRDALRTFSLERISGVKIHDKASLEIDDAVLERQLSSAFGIFSGEANQQAILRFTPERSQWVADEQWHPEQLTKKLDDGGVQLSIPYSDDRELIQEILRHGHHVKVLAPTKLQRKVAAQLDFAAKQYR